MLFLPLSNTHVLLDLLVIAEKVWPINDLLIQVSLFLQLSVTMILVILFPHSNQGNPEVGYIYIYT